jgi:hypothetical protein
MKRHLGLKPALFAAFLQGLKPLPPSAMSFFAACEAVPFQKKALIQTFLSLSQLFFHRQQMCQSLFRADVPLFQLRKLFFRLHAGGHGHEAVQTAGVVAAIFVLGAAVHRLQQ